MLLTRYCIGLVRMHVVVVCSLTLNAQYPRVGLMAGAPCDCGHRSCHVCFLMWVAELGLGGMFTSYFLVVGRFSPPRGLVPWRRSVAWHLRCGILGCMVSWEDPWALASFLGPMVLLGLGGDILAS